MKRTIKDEMTARGFNYNMIEGGDGDSELIHDLEYYEKWDLDSVCGKACLKLLDAAKPLLETIDPVCHGAVWTAVVHGMNVINLG